MSGSVARVSQFLGRPRRFLAVAICLWSFTMPAPVLQPSGIRAVSDLLEQRQRAIAAREDAVRVCEAAISWHGYTGQALRARNARHVKTRLQGELALLRAELPTDALESALERVGIPAEVPLWIVQAACNNMK